MQNLQRDCEQIAQQLGITDPVMVIAENLPAGDARNGPGRTVGGGIGACCLDPPQAPPQPLPEKPGPRPRPTIRPKKPIEDPHLDQATDASTSESPYPDDYCTPERNGGSNLCRNVVKICFVKGQPEPAIASELWNERALYLSEAERLRKANGGTLTRRSTRDLKRRKQDETEAARTRNPELYENSGKVPGHMPDLTWAPSSDGLDVNREIMPMDPSLNASIGAQAGRYPIDFVAEEFVGGTWITDFNGAQTCM